MDIIIYLVAGGVVGFFIGAVQGANSVESKEKKLKAGADEAWEEVKRLRAQVANLIGKE